MTLAADAARSPRPRATEGKQQMMRNRGSTAAIIFLAVVLGVGCNSWRGFGFRASGPEMPRLRHELALKPDMSVADVGAGSGELTVALAAEVGPGGRVFSTEIDSEALKQIGDNSADRKGQNGNSGLPCRTNATVWPSATALILIALLTLQERLYWDALSWTPRE